MLKLPKIEKFENIEISIKEVIGNQEETIALESTIIDEDDYKIYSFALDRANEPSKIEIEWVFLGQPRLPFLRLK